MANFADYFEVKLGEETVRGRRLSVKEFKELVKDGETPDVAHSIGIIRERCRLKSGAEFDPEELTADQVKTLVCEMILPKEGRGISDFIGLLC